MRVAQIIQGFGSRDERRERSAEAVALEAFDEMRRRLLDGKAAGGGGGGGGAPADAPADGAAPSSRSTPPPPLPVLVSRRASVADGGRGGAARDSFSMASQWVSDGQGGFVRKRVPVERLGSCAAPAADGASSPAQLARESPSRRVSLARRTSLSVCRRRSLNPRGRACRARGLASKPRSSPTFGDGG